MAVNMGDITYNHQILRMNFIELEYQTWQREQSYGMFDYSEPKNIKQHCKLIIKSPGRLFRNALNYDLVFVEKGSDKRPQNCHPFLKVEATNGHFFILNDLSQSDGEPLTAIAPLARGLKLREGDKIRLGKARIDLLRLAWAQKMKGNHYEMAKEPIMADRQSIFASSFYSQKEKASLIQTNPACRYCYSKTIDDENPFMALCKCSGSTKYIHLTCLVEWVKKRSGLVEDYPKQGVYCVQAKALTCEVCKSLYRVDHLLRQVFEVQKPQLEQFAVLLVQIQNPVIYVIDLRQEEQISIGRNLESLLIINELSVSRKHCRLSLDRAKKELLLIDNGAKFGTTVQVQKVEIYRDGHQFQKGRTKMRFSKKLKLSFFQKLGFCSNEDAVGKEYRR